MKLIVLLLVSATALTCGSASASILNDLVGTWRATATYSEEGRTVSETSQVVNKMLRGGIIYSTETAKINGRSVIVGKEWIMPGGAAVMITFDRVGKAELIGEANWRISGNAISGTYICNALTGRVTVDASNRRVNRNKWIASYAVKRGSNTLNIRSVMVRIR